MIKLQSKFNENNVPLSVKSSALETKKNTEHQNKLMELFKPLLITLSMFGLYFSRPVRGRKTKRCRALMIYCSIVFGILMAGVFNYTYFNHIQIVEFGPKSALHVLSYMYLLLNIITAFVMFVSCYRKDGLCLMFKKWKELYEIPEYSVKPSSRFKGIIGCVVIFSWIYFLFSVILFGFVTFATINGETLYSVLGISSYCWSLTVYIFHIATWTFPTAFITIISLGIFLEFRAYNTDFKQAVKSDGKFAGDFEAYRRRHQAICNLVSAFDDNFSIQFAAVLSITVAEILLQIYLSIWHPDYNSDPLPKAAMIQWIISSLFLLCLVCFCGGMINEMAHASLPHVYDCDLDKNKEIATKLQIFLSRLTGEKIGLTAVKMFVIDKTTILTAFGLIVTYYLVLEQFQSTASSCHTIFNNSTSSEH